MFRVSGSGGAGDPEHGRRRERQRAAGTAPAEPETLNTAGKNRGGRGVLVTMQLELTDDAASLLTKRGGTLTVDLIRPTG